MAAVFAAPLALGFFPRLRLPAIVVEIVLGIVIGPSVLGWVSPDLPVSILSLIGLAFLLFLAGLEIDVHRLRGRTLKLTALGFALSLVIGVLVGLTLKSGGFVKSPLFIAIVLVATSLGVIVPVLTDSDYISSNFGQLVIAAASIADFGAIILLSLFFSGEGSTDTAGTAACGAFTRLIKHDMLGLRFLGNRLTAGSAFGASPIEAHTRTNRRTRRSLDERLFVRWPRTYAALGRLTSLLPPRSRLRRALLRRAVLSGWSALARGDLDLMLVRFAPDCEFEVGPELVGVGMRGSYRGHAGMREAAADLGEAFERMELTPFEILDAGDRIVFLGHLHIRGGASGVELDYPYAEVLWVERGRIVRDNTFWDRDAALRAAGIPTDAPADLDLAADAAHPPG